MNELEKWLGESIAKDSKGKPIVFYHGSHNDFKEFDKTKIGSATDAGWLGRGFYFYTEYDQAIQYGPVREFYLKIENPYYPDHEEVRRLSDLNSKRASKKFTQALINEGHDGVFWNGDLRGETVVFEPDQIREVSSFEMSDEIIAKRAA